MQQQPRRAITGSDGKKTSSKTKILLDPLISLQVAMDKHTSSETPMGAASSRSSIASVCFLPTYERSRGATSATAAPSTAGVEGDDDDDDSDSSSSSDEEIQFQCKSLLQGESRSGTDPTRSARSTAAATHLLSNRYLASCHANGECLLWDLGRRQLAISGGGGSNKSSLVENRGPGWMLRRLDEGDNSDTGGDKSHFLYQTRDPRGTVSIHAWDHPSHATGTSATTVASFRTFSQTFCAATPCVGGNSRLLALPSANDSDATVRDWRMDPTGRPVAVFEGAPTGDGGNDEEQGYDPSNPRKHGMLTSLAFSECAGSWGDTTDSSSNDKRLGNRPIVACGMESGNVFFHDLRMLGKQRPLSIKLSDDPVLALDLAPSRVGASSDVSPQQHDAPPIANASRPSSMMQGVVAIAGMAGEAVAQQEKAVKDQGTVAILKATFPSQSFLLSDDGQESSFPKVRLRARLATCQPSGDGKPGVSLCRFQPGDGRLFAVAGWDQRVRIFDRAAQANSNKRKKAAPLAILQGHTDSIRTMDWAPDAESGLCATGAPDGRIHIWRCFSK